MDAAVPTPRTRLPNATQEVVWGPQPLVAAVRGARDAQELLNEICSGAAPAGTHARLPALRGAADGPQLRALTQELQRALHEGFRRASNLRELKEFTECRARLLTMGVHLYGTDQADGR